jgi:hypothetical protein
MDPLPPTVVPPVPPEVAKQLPGMRISGAVGTPVLPGIPAVAMPPPVPPVLMGEPIAFAGALAR